MKSDSITMKARRQSLAQKRHILRRLTPRVWTRKSQIRLREFQEKDKERIKEILGDVENFTLKEIAVAMSLVHEMLGGDRSYCFLVAADEDDMALGYICYGQAPMTFGTWEIYWIAVSKRYQNRHIGSMLLREAEREITVKGGRLIVIETSTKRSYRSTHKFYMKMGYQVSARIPRFYSEADDKLIFCKNLKS